MNEINLDSNAIKQIANKLNVGFYRVTLEGYFVECDSKALELLGIQSEDILELSSYSIKNFYPTNRDWDIKKKNWEQSNNVFSDFLVVKRNGKYKYLLNFWWYWDSCKDEGKFMGCIFEFDNITHLYSTFEQFPIGFYEVDKSGQIVNVNQKLADIIGYKSKSQLLDRNIKDLFQKNTNYDSFINDIKSKGLAQGIVRVINAQNRIIDLECFAKILDSNGFAHWGLVNDVTERERNLRLLNDLPTGYYYVENECVVECNNQFARILGFEKKEDIIGLDTRTFIISEEDAKKYFEALNAAFAEGKFLQKYHLEVRRNNDNEIITISIDVKLIKDKRGNIIGREGTIRDVSKSVNLRKDLYKIRENLKKTIEDINRLIHTFLHPVLKFSGNSELLHQMSQTLHSSFQSNKFHEFEYKSVSKKLLDELVRIRDDLNKMNGKVLGVEKNESLIAVNLEKQLAQIINLFDFSLQAKQNNFLMEGSLRDTALWILEKLNISDYKQYPALKSIIPDSFIEFLRGILFHYLTRGTQTLVGETEIMKRGVETIRSGIGLKTERKYGFVRRDVILILEKNIELFKPVFAEENLHIDYVRPRGEFSAEISQSDIDRLICNLMQNALKYSFKGTGRHIKIRAKDLHFENKIEFSIENFGVPIKKEEIENGKIWEYGYRGELAYLTDREGTGIGLADAKEVIDVHNGEIKIESKPALAYQKKNEYNVPYLTKVIVKIPRLRQRKD